MLLRRALLLVALVTACSSSSSAPPGGDTSPTDAVPPPPARTTPPPPGPEDAGADVGAPTGARQLCFVACTTSDDCTLNGGGVCTKGMCVVGAGADACKVDTECVPYGSSFEIRSTCTKKADCSANEQCIAWNGKGICQPAPSAGKPCSDHFEMVDVQWPSIEGPTVTVCGRTSYVCDGGKCRSGCEKDADCSSSSYPKCDVARHKCVCSGSSCSGGTFDGDVCLPDGRCGCHADSDCKVKQGFDRCYGDTCGCSGTAACDGIVQGATLVCGQRP